MLSRLRGGKESLASRHARTQPLFLVPSVIEGQIVFDRVRDRAVEKFAEQTVRFGRKSDHESLPPSNRGAVED